MYRYRDASGLTRTIRDDVELRAAIAEGRIPPGSPFAKGEESWTVASLHPAYQAAARGVKSSRAGARVGGRSLAEWGAAAQSPMGRLVLVALAVVVTFAAARGRRASDEAARAYFQELSVLLEGGEVPPALREPPSKKGLREGWALMWASRDVGEHMDATRARLGNPADGPEGWLSDRYMRSPSRYPGTADYWDAEERFHALYRDSLIPLMERGLRRYGAEAGMSDRALERTLAETRESFQLAVETHRASMELAGYASGLHHVLVAAERVGGVTIRPDGTLVLPTRSHLASYEAARRHYDRVEARVDSLRVVGDSMAVAAAGAL